MSVLRTDLNYAKDGTFRMNVTAGTSYRVRIYHANPKSNGIVPAVADNFDVWAEGVFQYNVASVAAGGTVIREFTITAGADGTSGTLDIRFWDRGGQEGNFVVSGMEIWSGTGTPPDMAPLVVGDVGGGASAGDVKLDAALLAPVVAEAAARWSAVGLTPAQSAALSEAQFAVADLGGSYLGLADVPAYRVQIDDDAAGRGWAVVTGQSSLVTGHWSRGDGLMTKDEGPVTTDGTDLLTVVLHEMGHLLGYGHSADPADLMAPVLAAGGKIAGSRAEAVESLGQAGWRRGLCLERMTYSRTWRGAISTTPAAAARAPRRCWIRPLAACLMCQRSGWRRNYVPRGFLAAAESSDGSGSWMTGSRASQWCKGTRCTRCLSPFWDRLDHTLFRRSQTRMFSAPLSVGGAF
jgi:hypothetical protein